MKRFVLLVVVMLVLVPSVVLAQGDVTLEDLVNTVTDLISRVETLESVFVGRGSYATDRGCRIGGVFTNPDVWNQQVQSSTVVKYFESLGRFPDAVSSLQISNIEVLHDGKIAVMYWDVTLWDIEQRPMGAEIWDGCEFVESTHWVGPEQK